MQRQSQGDDGRHEDTLVNDSIRYLLLRTQMPTMREVKTLVVRRKQTVEVLNAHGQWLRTRRFSDASGRAAVLWSVGVLAGIFVWVMIMTLARAVRDSGNRIFTAFAIVAGTAILGLGVEAASRTRLWYRSHSSTRALRTNLERLTRELGSNLPVERVVHEARLSYPKFNREKRRIDGIRDVMKELRSGVALYWRDVMILLVELENPANSREDIDENIRREAIQYLEAWGPPPVPVDPTAKPRFGWSAYSSEQVREWDHWSHLIAAACGCRRALATMGVELPTIGPLQLPPEVASHSVKWQERHGIEPGKGVEMLQEQPVADFEAALSVGEGPAKSRFAALLSASELSDTDLRESSEVL